MNTAIEQKVLVQIPSTFFLEEGWKASVKLSLVGTGLKIQEENEDAIKKLDKNNGRIYLGVLPEVMNALWNNIDIEAIKIQIARLYADCFYAWLCQTMGVGCGSNTLDLDSVELREGAHIYVEMPIKRIQRLRETTDEEWLRHFMKGYGSPYYPPAIKGVFPLKGRSTSKWLKEKPEQWDETQLGVLFAAWTRTHGFFVSDIERRAYNEAVETSNFKDFMNAVCLNLDLDKVELDLFGCSKMERRAERLAKECMEDPHWIKNAVEQLQEPLVEHNEDIIDLIAGTVDLYQTGDTASFLPIAEPFWDAIKSRALEQAWREIEDPEREGVFID